MDTLTASTAFDGDLFRLYVDDIDDWEVEPVDLYAPVLVFTTSCDRQDEQGRFAGIEIGGFLDFDAWNLLPTVPHRIRVGDDPAGSLRDVLAREQSRLRASAAAA